MSVWFVDSSVIVRALVNNSTAARRWLDAQDKAKDEWYGSRMLELEVSRVVRDAGADPRDADHYLDRFDLVSITDDIVDAASALPHRLGGADSIHVATAMRLRSLPLTFITHDPQQARAIEASQMFDVHDPVADDPTRSPVA